jgi:hypothetical protein
MKNLKIVLSILLITFFSSCSNEEENNTVIEQLHTEKNIKTQRVIYNFLTVEEKAKIWTDRVNELLTEENLTFEQINVLVEVKNYILTIYSSENKYLEDNELFVNKLKKDKEIIDKCLLYFSKDYVYHNFFNLTPIIKSNLKNSPIDHFVISIDDNDCKCHLDSYFTCGILTNLKCKKSNFCKKLPDGCGTWFSNPCDGKCSF